MNRGAIFTIDALMSLIILLFMIFGAMLFLNNQVLGYTKSRDYFFLEEKTIFVADSLIKNFNSENTLLGSCIYDIEKHRVRSNELALVNILLVKPFSVGNFFVKSISFNGFEKKMNDRFSENCVSVKRMAFVDGIKKVVLVTGCLE